MVSWTPHCNNINACEKQYGINRVPQFYTIKYTSVYGSEVFAVENRKDNDLSFPSTARTLNDLQSNTEYKISVSTNTYTMNSQTVNSNFNQSFGYTG